MSLRRFFWGLTAGLLLASSQAAELTITCGAASPEADSCLRYAKDWAKKTGNSIRNFSQPGSSTDQLSLYRQLFAAKSGDIDVLQMDVVWPGLLKDHLLDLLPYTKGIEKEHFPAIVANNMADGKLVGMPWYTDAGLLYYRKDLLAKYQQTLPRTWDELSRVARTIQNAERAAGNSDFQGFVFQGKAYEGLTCNALEWVASFGGGSIVKADGSITVSNPQTIAAFKLAASWIGDIAPIGVLNYQEEEARGVFQNGKAMFMRNWPYAWGLAQKEGSLVQGKVGISKLPGVMQLSGQISSAAALGGWQMAVNRYSKNPALAADLALYMTSREVQKDRAIRQSFNPTIQSLYQDPEIAAANPFMAALYEVFANATARPTTATALKYPQVSQSFWNAAHETMSRRTSGEDAVKKLDKRLQQIKRKAWIHQGAAP